MKIRLHVRVTECIRQFSCVSGNCRARPKLKQLQTKVNCHLIKIAIATNNKHNNSVLYITKLMTLL